MLLKIILNLIIQLRKALEMNMTTDSMEVEMHKSAIGRSNTISNSKPQYGNYTVGQNVTLYLH